MNIESFQDLDSEDEVRYYIQKKVWKFWMYLNTFLINPSIGFQTADLAEKALYYYLNNKDTKVIKEFKV